MSLVTRCPSCATTFKVVRDQLRISDGWVRCGRCSHVFDATLDLQEASDGGGPAVSPAPPPEENPAPPGEPAPPPAEPEPLPAPAWLPASRPELPTELPAEREPQPAPEPVPPREAETFRLPPPVWPELGVVADEPWPESPAAPAMAMAPVLAQASLTSSIGALDEFAAVIDRAADAQLQRALRRARIEELRNGRRRKAAQPAAAPATEPTDLVFGPLPRAPSPASPFAASMPMVSAESIIEAPTPAVASPSFSPPAAAPRDASGRTGRRALVIASIAGALLLMLQVLRHERDALATRQPSLRPALAALCSVTGCELAALRQIGAITIDGAAFEREKSGDGYRLSFTLRNAVAIPLAMPAVELSLLDTQERAVVRRVLMPADFGAPAVLSAKAERTVSMPLALTGPEAAALPPVAGYRVVAFYP